MTITLFNNLPNTEFFFDIDIDNPCVPKYILKPTRQLFLKKK